MNKGEGEKGWGQEGSLSFILIITCDFFQTIQGGSTILRRMSSPVKVLMEVFPDIGLDASKFKTRYRMFIYPLQENFQK